MCLSKAFFERDGERQLVAEEVTSIEFSGETLRLKTLFGELKEVGARVREIDFLTHSILLEEPKESGASL